MSSGYINLPIVGAPTWRSPVNTASNLPALGNQYGDARVSVDTFTIYVWTGAAWEAPAGGGGTVSSVGLSAPDIFNVSGSPVTAHGTLALSLAVQAANVVWAGPVSGGSATPTFRALVAADIPSLPYQPIGSYITALTGDGTASGPGSAALTLATVNSAPGSVGSASSALSITVNAKGLVTAATATAIQIAESQVTNLVSDLASKQAALTPGSISTSTPGVTVGSGSSSTVGPNVIVNVQTASGSQPGLLSAADWTTFNAKQAALTPGSISTSTTGVSVGSGSASTVGPNVTVNVQTASATQPGLLSAADWGTFNSKQSALTLGNLTTSTAGLAITGGTGAVIGSGATVNVQTASGSQPGLLSAADWATFAAKQAAGAYITALTGDVTAAGPGSAVASLTAVSNNTITTLSALSLPLSQTTGTLPINRGGTNATAFTAPSGTIDPSLYFNGTSFVTDPTPANNGYDPTNLIKYVASLVAAGSITSNNGIVMWTNGMMLATARGFALP